MEKNIFSQVEEIKNKKYKTKKLNNTFNSSKPEKYIEITLNLYKKDFTF